jgi:hypothetical protein
MCVYIYIKYTAHDLLVMMLCFLALLPGPPALQRFNEVEEQGSANEAGDELLQLGR